MTEKDTYKAEEQVSNTPHERYAMLRQFNLTAEDIVDTIRIPLLILTPDLKVAFANNSFYQTFAVTAQETEGRSLFDLGNGQWDIPELRQKLETIVTRNFTFQDFEVEHGFQYIGKRIMHINARGLDHRKNHRRFILLSISDVTEQIQMERNLKEYRDHLEELVLHRAQKFADLNKKLSEEKEWLKVTLRSIGDAVVATDIHGRITLINHAAQTLVGCSQESALGKLLPEVVHIVDEHSHTPITHLVEKIIESKGATHVGRQLCLVSSDGRRRTIADSGRPILDKKGQVIGTVIVFHDITEEKIMAEKLIQSHKMESIGTLAGGIAHDFNNILFAIMGYTDLAMLEAADNNKLLAFLEKTYQACNRAKDLVQQILTYSSHTQQEVKPVEIHSVINEAIQLIRASLPSTIKIDLDINSDANILADATQIYQVIYNLCTNAAHAIQDPTGLIQIRLVTETVNEDLSLIHPELKPGRYVKLSVVDSGQGISSEIKHKIFDPFFTTKQLSKGTGMGLSVVHGIITSYGGSISVFSEPGKGTTFDVYFPALEKRDDTGTEVDQFEPVQTGDESILLVDDEQQLVEMEQQMLKKLGYTVTTETSSRKALELFRSVPDRFDLVITDLTMPEMNGYLLAQKLKEIRPNLPIILCSGYHEYGSKKKIQEMGISAFILKPVTLMDLSRIARKILDRKKIERRKNERFKIKGKAVAIVKSAPRVAYEIADISCGGMAIYLNSLPEPEKRFNEISIRLVDKGILLDKIPCKVISDQGRHSGLYSNDPKRQGLEFGKLAFHQLNVLDHLIHSHTVVPT